jgi:hypothetical protein
MSSDENSVSLEPEKGGGTVHRVGAQVRVDAREAGVDVVGDGHRTAESPCPPDDLGGPLDESGDVQHLVRSGADCHQAVIGDQRRGAAFQRLHRIAAHLGCGRCRVFAAADGAAAVDGELVDVSRPVLIFIAHLLN